MPAMRRAARERGDMKKLLSLFIATAMALSLVAPADAAQRPRAKRPVPPPPVDAHVGPFRIGNPNVFGSGVAVGAASTGAYFALRERGTLKVAGDGRHFSTGAFLLTTVGCMTLAPMFASAVVWHAEGRHLTSREALGLGAGCIIPIIGPLLVNAAFDSHPAWR